MAHSLGKTFCAGYPSRAKIQSWSSSARSSYNGVGLARENFCPNKFSTENILPQSLKVTGKMVPHFSMVKGKAQGQVSPYGVGHHLRRRCDEGLGCEGVNLRCHQGTCLNAGGWMLSGCSIRRRAQGKQDAARVSLTPPPPPTEGTEL